MNKTHIAYLQMHIAVILFGFTAILGKVILLSGLVLVWWRMLLTTASLIAFPKMISKIKEIPLKLKLRLAGIGVLIAIHWVLFYASIKAGNSASITLCTMATVSFITAILEPLILRQRFKWFELALGAMVIPGMYFVVKFTGEEYYLAIIMGLLSAALAALFSICNKAIVDQASNESITFMELGSGCLFLTLLLPIYLWLYPNEVFWPVMSDWLYLAILALLCTTFAFIISLAALRFISAFASNLIINLEPVYGVLLAILFFKENQDLSSGFYIGMAIIMTAVFSYPVFNKLFAEKASK